MRPNASAEPLDLERDLPTTPEDVEALHRLRLLPRMTDEEYLAFLCSFPEVQAPALRDRPGPGGVPFELP